MTALYFAQAKRLAGLSSEESSVTSPLKTDAFWRLLIAFHSSRESLRCSCLARGDEFLPAKATIHPDDEIALIPPVSGG